MLLEIIYASNIVYQLFVIEMFRRSTPDHLEYSIFQQYKMRQLRLPTKNFSKNVKKNLFSLYSMTVGWQLLYCKVDKVVERL